MIQLLVTDNLFWDKVDFSYGSLIREAYTIPRLEHALRTCLEIQIKNVPNAKPYERNKMMVDRQGLILIDWYDDGPWPEELIRLDKLKRIWYSQFKQILGELLAKDYLLENPIVSSKLDVLR